MLHFEEEYGDHLEDRDICLLTVSNSPRGEQADERYRAAASEREESTVEMPRQNRRSLAGAGIGKRPSDHTSILSRMVSNFINPGLELDPGTTEITFQTNPVP
jgi:hypothetical protein